MKQDRAKTRPTYPTEEHLRSLVASMAVISAVSVAVMAVAGSYGLWQAHTGTPSAEQNVLRPMAAAEVREQYLAQRVELLQKLDSYLADQTAASHYSEFKSVRDELVALMVPPSEQTHHLELVLALSRFVDLVEPGAKTSPTEVTRARQDLTSVLTPLAL